MSIFNLWKSEDAKARDAAEQSRAKDLKAFCDLIVIAAGGAKPSAKLATLGRALDITADDAEAMAADVAKFIEARDRADDLNDLRQQVVTLTEAMHEHEGDTIGAVAKRRASLSYKTQRGQIGAGEGSDELAAIERFQVERRAELDQLGADVRAAEKAVRECEAAIATATQIRAKYPELVTAIEAADPQRASA